MAENILWILTVYLMLMNAMGLVAMGVDKAKAKRHTWRIPEKRLFRYVGRNVSVQAQNKALVFCCGDACDIYITGGCRKVAVS